MSELTVSSTNPSAAGTFTIEDSTGVEATVQASDLQAKFGQRTRIEFDGVSSDVAIHASANTVVAGVTTVSSICNGALTLTVGSTNYAIDLTGVTAQNSAITTAVVSALQTASVGTSVGTFSVQDSSRIRILRKDSLKLHPQVRLFKFNLQGRMRRQLSHLQII